VGRILLWSPETQVATVTAIRGAHRNGAETWSARRPTQALSAGRIPASLECARTCMRSHRRRWPFPRTLELVNRPIIQHTGSVDFAGIDGPFFPRRRPLLVLDVTDRYTAYGIVGVLLVSGNEIIQFVMIAG